MRNLKRIVLVLMMGSLLTWSSCSKSDDGGGGDATAAAGTLTATVDGKSYQSMEISSSATLVNAGSVKNLVIIASNSDGNAFAMTIFGYTGTGTYEFTGANVAVTNTASYTETAVNLSNPMASTTEIWQAPFDATLAGSITIDEETATNLKGTFSFTCKNVNGDQSIKNVTSGAFNLEIQTAT
ncbi:DUF6252 family protein [Flavobacteriaceae bacterium SZ-1-7]|uniref:DUF6252 family protein n=1 Tax=Tamlana sedimenti TaxID=3134126 RepID=UPI0031291439